MTRLVVTADLHIDDYGKAIDPESGQNQRFVDGLNTTRWVAERAREFKADALIVAGDYTERRSPAPPRVARIVESLEAGPARQVHVRGNHDSAVAGRSIVDVLGGRPGWEGHTTPGISMVGDVAVCVIPFLGKSALRSVAGFETADQADVFRALSDAYLTIARGQFVAAQRMGAAAAILVGHQQLSGGRMTDSQAAFLGDMDVVVDSRALAAIGFVAVVFGHVHRGQTVIDAQDCPVVFAGSVERVDWAEELEPKSYLVVDVEGGRATIERIPTPARHMVTVTGDGSFIEAAVEDSIVRGKDLDPDVDTVAFTRALMAAGALEVVSLAKRRVDVPAIAGGLSEGLTPSEALVSYFEGEPDAEATIERGRALLAAVAS